MSLFNELHSKYYTLVNHILSSISEEGADISTLRKIITTEGFLETPTVLLPLLTSQTDEGYHLLHKENTTYYSVLQNPPITFLTQTQKSWLKTLTLDPKIHLFLDEDELYQLKKVLRNVEPLFLPETIHPIHQASLDTDFTNQDYIHLFRSISNYLHHHEYMKISYTNEESECITTTVAGYKLEYRMTQDSFHLIGVSENPILSHTVIRINLRTITAITPMNNYFDPTQIEGIVKAYKCKEPIFFELSNERKGFDRAFMHLSNYERITEFNEETHTCLVQLFYYPFDEEELINILISFGPIIKILGPTHIKNQFKERIKKQFLLFKTQQ